MNAYSHNEDWHSHVLEGNALLQLCG